MSDPLPRVIDALDSAGMKPKKSGKSWRTFCPVHENPPNGHTPSLSVARGRKQPVVLRCQAGCDPEAVMAALGMDLADVCEGVPTATTASPSHRTRRQRTGAPSDSAPVRPLEEREDRNTLGKERRGREDGSCSVSACSPESPVQGQDWRALQEKLRADLRLDTLTAFSAALCVKPDALDGLGIGYDASTDALTVPMRSAAGEIIGIRRRPRKDPRSKSAVEGSCLGLFIPDGATFAPEVVCEGETDTAAALTLGVSAVGLPGAGQAVDVLAESMRQSPVACPCLIADANAAGRAGAERAAKALLAAGVPCRVLVPPEPYADLREWLTAGKVTAAELRAAIEAVAIRWPDRSAGWIPGFTQPPNQFTRRCLELLGPERFALAMLLASHDAGDGQIHPSRDELARIMHKSVSTIGRWLNDLEDAGVIKRRRGRTGRCNEYVVRVGPCKGIRRKRKNGA